MRSTIILSLVVVLATMSKCYYIEDLRPPMTLTLGEGPHWDADKKELLFVDIEGRNVFRYLPETKEFYYVKLDGRVSLVVPIKDSPNEYLIGVEQTFKIMTWDGVSDQPTKLTSLETVIQNPKTRINDGKCDPSGRLIAGTMDETGGNRGHLYRFDSNGKLELIELGVGISNGLAWTNDNTTMYYIDTPTLQIDSFDYNIETGVIGNRNPIYNLPYENIKGSPDGMAIDADGNIWVCLFGGSGILHINPGTRTLIQKIDLSNYASQVTSAAFGGKNLDILYVTTAQFNREAELSSGSLLAIHGLGVRGAGGGIPFVRNF